MAGSFEGVLANIPGYGGYLAKETYNRNQTLGDIQQMTGIQGMLAKMQEQHRAQQVQSVLADPSIPPEQKRMALIGLMRDPTQAATGMHQIATENANADLRKSQMETQARLLEGEKRKAAQDARVAGASDQLSSLLTPGVSPTDGAQRMPFVGSEAELVQHMQKNPGVYSRVDPAQVRGLQAIIDPKETAKGMLSHGKQDAPYTLSPGAIRFGPNGEQIATAPFAPRVDPAPQIVQTSNGPVVLPRGSTTVTPLTDQQGRTIDSKDADKARAADNKETAAFQSGTADLDRLALEANKVLNHPGLKSITGLRGAIPNIPGTDAADAQALLGTLKSQIGFGVLQTMRNNSKTGGALGSVSDAEGKRLEANLASLEKAQSLPQFQQSLNQIIKFTNDAKDRLRGAYNMRSERNTGGASGSFEGGGKVMQIKGDAEYNMLPKGARYVGPDGVERVK